MFSFSLDDEHCLRLIEEADAEELHRVVAANREFLAAWMPWAAGQTLEGTVEFIRSSRKQWAANQGFQAVILERGLMSRAALVRRRRIDDRAWTVPRPV